MFGVGGSSANTDRSQTLGSYGNLNNIYSLGLGTGTSQEATGQSFINQSSQSLQPASDYYKSLLTAGRTQTAQQAQPAIQSAMQQGDAQRSQAAAEGTSRTGATVAGQAEAGQKTASNIDTIINQNLVGGKATGAAGMTQVAGQQAQLGGMTLANAMQMLGLGESAQATNLSNSINSRDLSNQIAGQEGSALGSAAAMLMFM
jgi:hypothetical protein